MQNLTSLSQTSSGNIQLASGKSISLGAACLPLASDGGALGSGTKMWSDLFLASGAVVNFNNGDVTITHSSNKLAFAAGTSYTFDAVITPAAIGGSDLGTAALSWGNLYVVEGGTINFNNANVVLTHAADVLTLTGGKLALTGEVGQCVLVGASSSSPILVAATGTTNIVEINSKLTAVSGTLRGLISYAEFSGVNVGAGTNLYAIRGYAKMSGTAAGSNTFYSAGVQGKLELSGTVSGGKHCAVLAQLNASAGLAAATAGTIYCLWADGMQINAQPAAALYVTGVGVELPDGATYFDSVFYAYGKATVAFDLTDSSSYIVAATTKTTPAGVDNWITVSLNGNTRYIPTYASTTA